MPKGLLRSGVVAAFDFDLWRALQTEPIAYEIDSCVKLGLNMGLIKSSQGTPAQPGAITAEKDGDNIVLLVKLVNADAHWLLLDGSNANTTIDLQAQDLENVGNLGLGAPSSPTERLVIASEDGSDNIKIYHDNSQARITWSDGGLNLRTDEGTNTNTFMNITGKGTGIGFLQMLDEDNAEAILISCASGSGRISTLGTSPVALDFQREGEVPVRMYVSSNSGVTKELMIYGYRAGDVLRHVDIGVGVDAVDTASFDGVSNYLFDGNINAANKTQLTETGGHAIKLTNKTGANSVAGELVIASAGTADAVDLAGANELMPIGAFLESGIADGSEAWVVVGGIADVRADAAGWALGDRIVTSATAGRGAANNIPAVAVHFQEVGHAIEAAAANANARIVMHFN